MKAKLFFTRTLRFNLDDDTQAFLRCIKATDLCSVLWKFSNWLRSEIKYSDDTELSKHKRIQHQARIKALEEAREKLCEIMNDENINFDELYS